jgi:hypothetical protein
MFELALQVQRDALATAQPGQVSPDYELSTAEAQIMAACELLADASVAGFRLICCGDRPWPVDVRTDLSVFLEQSVGLLQALDERAPFFRLEMYEQGIETVRVFRREEGRVNAHCEPLVAGAENRFGTKDEELGMEVLVRAVAGVVAGFIECCERLCPHLLALPEMTSWQKTVEHLAEHLLGAEA